MSIKTLPNGTPAACYEIKSNGDGRFYFQAFGFKSLPFELKDMVANKKLFSMTIHGKVQGTVQ